MKLKHFWKNIQRSHLKFLGCKIIFVRRDSFRGHMLILFSKNAVGQPTFIPAPNMVVAPKGLRLISPIIQQCCLWLRFLVIDPTGMDERASDPTTTRIRTVTWLPSTMFGENKVLEETHIHSICSLLFVVLSFLKTIGRFVECMPIKTKKTNQLRLLPATLAAAAEAEDDGHMWAAKEFYKRACSHLRGQLCAAPGRCVPKNQRWTLPQGRLRSVQRVSSIFEHETRPETLEHPEVTSQVFVCKITFVRRDAFSMLQASSGCSAGWSVFIIGNHPRQKCSSFLFFTFFLNVLIHILLFRWCFVHSAWFFRITRTLQHFEHLQTTSKQPSASCR